MNPARATTTDLAILGPAYARVSRIGLASQQAALNAGSDYLDGKLGDQFTLPLTEPYPQDVIDFEVMYAGYRLLLNVGFNPMPGNGDEAIKHEYEKWLLWADDLAAGKISLRGLTRAAGSSNYPDVVTSTTRGYSERGISPGAPPFIQTNPFSDD